MRVFRREYPGPDGTKREGLTYWCQYSVGGVRYYESTGSRDKRAAELVAHDRMRRAELARAGIKDPYGEAKAKPIAEHLRDFLTTIEARGVVPKYLAERRVHLETYFRVCGVKKADDLDLARASAWVRDLVKRDLAARSVNARRAAICQFSKWMASTRRTQFDALAELKPLCEEADRRRVRRALTPEEAGRLVDAARTRAVARAGVLHPRAKPERRERAERTLAKMTRLGETRALIYLLALGTGLRRGELSRVRRCDIDLEGARITIPAASAKSRRAQVVDLHPALVDALRAHLGVEGLPTATLLPPRSMPNAWTFDRDLAAAGIAKSDAEGRAVDFHALRHTAITWAAMTGPAPKVLQAFARHASLRTTEKYTDMRLFDVRGTVARMPLPATMSPHNQASRRGS